MHRVVSLTSQVRAARATLLLGALVASACELPAELSVPASHVVAADLSLVQALDRESVRDGDLAAYEKADVSTALLYGRRPSASDGVARAAACSDDPRVQLGLVSIETCVGAELFFREPFGGNGRTCGSCHPAANNFTLDADFIATLPADDPLFVYEREPGLDGLEHDELLRDHGLVLENIDGFEDPTHKFVMRAVSHLYGLSATITAPPRVPPNRVSSDGTPIPPLHRTGWGGDGSPGRGALRDFATGAVEQHATRSLARTPYVDFIPPSENQLDALERFQLNIGRKNEIDTFEVQLTDPAAERGRLSMLSGPARVCEDCHINAGANNFNTESGMRLLVNSTFPLDSDGVRLPRLDELGIPRDGGFGKEPMDSDGDGVPEAFGRGIFNSQSLIEAADTAPFFHANASATLEDAIRFYLTDVFKASLSAQVIMETHELDVPFELSDTDVEELARFLRVLNVSFNCQLARARLGAAFQINDAFGNRYIAIQRGLLELASVELEDALHVLEEVEDLNLDARDRLREAQSLITRAKATLYRHERVDATRHALVVVSEANDLLGSGMDFQIGDGSLMF